jgi:hypothetical protein
MPPGILITSNGALITLTTGGIRRLIAVSWNRPATPPPVPLAAPAPSPQQDKPLADNEQRTAGVGRGNSDDAPAMRDRGSMNVT